LTENFQSAPRQPQIFVTSTFCILLYFRDLFFCLIANSGNC